MKRPMRSLARTAASRYRPVMPKVFVSGNPECGAENNGHDVGWRMFQKILAIVRNSMIGSE